MKKIFILLIFFVFKNCSGQIKNGNDKNMEKFDIVKYNELLKDSFFADYGYYYAENGDRIQIFKGSNNKGFVQKIIKKDSPFKIYKSYFENLYLQTESNFFYDFQIGISKEYDDNGNLIKEINNDIDFKFNVEDLIKKMKESYNIDIMNTKIIHAIVRNSKDVRIKKSYYHIIVKSGIAVYKEFLIDGNSGDSLFILENKRDYEKDIVDEYLKSKK
ncbi:hypothetical protein [Flavobacterium oreochromis]|uniref:Uncharacterized protein n=2 Tax=Flavobacterium TaxID=237 RepID=A0A246G760_9FLAO|nr:hypothetical protein [Flavobacterium oreochromis]OWP74071.1 hypothetical protein BWG23_15075 [Flavobacterium oreochromis]OWP74146.1 hypothetical protein BWK62_14935 [Flavobacterium oreochromis]